MNPQAALSPSLRARVQFTRGDAPEPATTQQSEILDPDEEYSESEQRLNDFLSQHPMINLEAASGTCLQLVNQMFEDRHEHKECMQRDLVCIPKSYDDRFLRPANTEIGERACACGDSCICKFLAEFRYGKNTEFSFTCVEFLLPEQRDVFLRGGGLPTYRRKCLLCVRYFQTYIYTLARTDPNFKLVGNKVKTQDFCNLVSRCGSNEVGKFWNMQPEDQESYSEIGTSDGYHQSALLFVDEQFTSQSAGRQGPMSKLFWKPVVKFSARHYVYCMDSQKKPFLKQIGVSATQTTAPHF